VGPRGQLPVVPPAKVAADEFAIAVVLDGVYAIRGPALEGQQVLVARRDDPVDHLQFA